MLVQQGQDIWGCTMGVCVMMPCISAMHGAHAEQGFCIAMPRRDVVIAVLWVCLIDRAGTIWIATASFSVPPPVSPTA